MSTTEQKFNTWLANWGLQYQPTADERQRLFYAFLGGRTSVATEVADEAMKRLAKYCEVSK